MLLYDVLHIWHATVTEFNRIFVDDTCVTMIIGEVFPNQLEEDFT